MTNVPLPTLRRLRTAELLAVGSELTGGETRDTNGGSLARSLGGLGVGVRRIVALPDDLALVTDTFREALAAVDLVVSTGGLGPTPDDLTREAVAAAVGETPTVDPRQEHWLRRLFERRGIALAEINLKQAWLIPSATAIPNANGTAPGWWVDRPDGRVIVLLPGPPREMEPMWTGWALPRLRERGLGDGRLVRTLRTFGIGESQAAERLGDEMLRRPNPVVATYARADWLDIRISAVDEAAADGADGEAARPAAELLAATEAKVRSHLAGHVWAEGETSWADLLAAAADAAGVRIATVEAGTHGSLAALLGDVQAVAEATVLGLGLLAAGLGERLEVAAAGAAADAGVAVGVAVVAHETAAGMRLRAAIAGPGAGTVSVREQALFQRGAQGRFRAAVTTTAFLVEHLGGRPPG
jgi:nicotinamide-nucleotide amidase